MVDNDIGGYDVDATQPRLVTPDGDGEGLGWERLESGIVFDLDNWTSVSKWENQNSAGDGQPWTVQGVRARNPEWEKYREPVFAWAEWMERWTMLHRRRERGREGEEERNQ